MKMQLKPDNKNGSLLPRLNDAVRSPSATAVFSSLASILIGFLFGGLVILVIALIDGTISLKVGFDAMRLIIGGIFSTGKNDVGGLTFGFNPVLIGNMLFRATPVIFTGMSVAVAFKTGLFNIGAPGQYLMGTAATLWIALSVSTASVPSWIVWLLAFVGGMLAGALWGALPGVLKAFLNMNEVIACIMTNWAAALLVSWFFSESPLRNTLEDGKIGYIYKTSANGVVTPKLGLNLLFPGSQVDSGILIAVLFAVAMYILIEKTAFGYELKACGNNRHAAKYAGIADKRNIVLSMAIAGALAAAGASLYWLSGGTEFAWNTYQSLPGEGFNGIPVALLAMNNPIAVVFTGCFMSALTVAGQQIKNLTAYNEYITEIIIASIVYLSAFSLVIRMVISGQWLRKKKPAHASVEVETVNGTSAPDTAPDTAPDATPESAADSTPDGAVGTKNNGEG